jgi:hypothetical protein
VTVHNSSAEQALGDTTTTEATTTTTAPATTTSTTADLPTRVGTLEHRVTRIEATTTTTAPAKPEVSFYYEGTAALGPGPDGENAPYDGTWKVVFRTTLAAPGLRVRFVAQARTGPVEFTAAFSDPRPMYTQSAIARIDAALFDVPENPPKQSPNRFFFQKIVAVEWDGGSETF